MPDIIPSKRIIFVLRASPSIWESLKKAVDDTNDSTVILIQAQAKTYAGNGATNTSLFAQQQWDDHPGPPPTEEEKERVRQLLKDPDVCVDIVNTSVGEHASDRATSGQLMVQYLGDEYGVKNIRYIMPYDPDGRNDKRHITQYQTELGKIKTREEDVIPSGMFMPRRYCRLGATAIAAFDPHSVYHIGNLTQPFGKDRTAILSNIPAITDQIIIRHADSIRQGLFRIGAPDGWDKKDDPTKNMATERVKDVLRIVWGKMPDIHTQYDDVNQFIAHSQFGITKIRKAAFKGAPAKPEITGVHGNVDGCVCVLLDDLVDSGSSLIGSGEILLKQGALYVDTAIAHGPATKEALNIMLNTTVEVNGRATLVLNHHILTNTVTRLEDFIQKLDARDKNRITLVNCGNEIVRELAKPFPKKPSFELSPAYRMKITFG